MPAVSLARLLLPMLHTCVGSQQGCAGPHYLGLKCPGQKGVFWDTEVEGDPTFSGQTRCAPAIFE